MDKATTPSPGSASLKTAETRRNLLAAAERVVLRDGVMHLTLDAVAREAGASKGGLLYHFPSKDALIGGMVGQALGDFDAWLAEETARDDGTPERGRWLRAYVNGNFVNDERERAVGAALAAAVTMNPATLTDQRDHLLRWSEQAVADGADAVLATIIRLAADSIWVSDLFGYPPLEEPLRSQVRDRLLRMTTEMEGEYE